jgi:hypothetical protein
MPGWVLSDSAFGGDGDDNGRGNDGDDNRDNEGTFGDVASFECGPGYTGAGGRMICDSDRTWIAEGALCEETTTATSTTGTEPSSTTSSTQTAATATTTSVTSATTTTTSLLRSKADYLTLSADELQQLGKNAHELLLPSMGFTPSELAQVGFQTADIVVAVKPAGGLYDAADLKKLPGVTVGMLKVGGFSANELRAVGYSAKSLTSGGYTAKEVEVSQSFAPAAPSSGSITSVVGISAGVILLVIAVAVFVVRRNARSQRSGGGGSGGGMSNIGQASFENPAYSFNTGSGGGGAESAYADMNAYADVGTRPGFGEDSPGYMDVSPTTSDTNDRGNEYDSSDDEEV